MNSMVFGLHTFGANIINEFLCKNCTIYALLLAKGYGFLKKIMRVVEWVRYERYIHVNY